MDELSALQASGLFGDATVEQLAPLLPALRRRAFARGAHLWHVGEPTGLAMVLLSGLVKTCHIAGNGREFVISVRGPGETVGAYHLFATDSRRMYDVIAVERTECLVIARDVLMYQLEREPSLMRRLASALLERIMKEAGNAMETPAAGDIRSRLAHRLLELAERYGESTQGAVRIPFALPQPLLAGLTGSSREKVNRALMRLVSDGLLSRDPSGRLTLLKPDELRRALE